MNKKKIVGKRHKVENFQFDNIISLNSYNNDIVTNLIEIDITDLLNLFNIKGKARIQIQVLSLFIILYKYHIIKFLLKLKFCRDDHVNHYNILEEKISYF